MTKAPIPTEKLKKKSKWQHKNATKNFYYITIADRLRTMSFRESHPIDVVNSDDGFPTFPQNAKAV